LFRFAQQNPRPLPDILAPALAQYASSEPYRLALNPHGSALRPMNMLRRYLSSRIRNITRAGTRPVDFSQPAGDPGLFGPDSMVWRVHQDFTSMMVGGVSALMLQALHPRVLSGVWDHSNFRDDLQGRLGRTSFFIACTTYGGTELAEQSIARVRQVHGHVTGQAPDGQPYSANDPALLTWVHASEAYGFLSAYIAYVDATLTERDQDRYLAEMAMIAAKLGAPNVPQTRHALDTYLQSQRPLLDASDRTREVLRILAQFEPRVMAGLFMRAGSALLPAWAADMLAVADQAPTRAALSGDLLRLLAPMARWALAEEGVVTLARRRVGR